MRSYKRKLIMSVFASVMTAACLTSTTYAWFARNTEAWTEELDFNVEGEKGLQISLDGKNFYQDITAKEFKQYIEETYSVEDYNTLTFGDVTLSQDEEGKIKFDDASNALFVMDKLNENADGTITHGYQDATQNKDYLAFDLYFRLIYNDIKLTNEDLNNFKLRLAGKDVDNPSRGTQIKGDTYTLPLINKLTAVENGTIVNKISGDTVDVNLKNAMRLGIQSPKGLTIYESNEGLGSAAIEGAEETDLKHNKDCNAMYTYYNNYYSRYPFEKAATDGDAFKTEDIDAINDNEIASFTYNEESKDFEVLKLKVYIWVEGWDADNLYTLPKDFSLAKVSLDFKI